MTEWERQCELRRIPRQLENCVDCGAPSPEFGDKCDFCWDKEKLRDEGGGLPLPWGRAK